MIEHVAVPDDAELERLGLYDPRAPDADDRLRIVKLLFELGGTVEEVTEAVRSFQWGDLALDLSIRPPGETLDLDDYAESSGFDPDLVRQVWQALGLPGSGPVRVTPDAATAVRVLIGLSGLVSAENTFAMARVIGSSSARMAEALIGAFRVDVEVPHIAAGEGAAARVQGTVDAGKELLPLFIEAANGVFRRHMVLASYQLWSTDKDRAAVTHNLVVGFADLVGSTEMVRAGSIAELARNVREFETRTWDVVARAAGRVVKLIGDEAMFVVEHPDRACAAALELLETSPAPIRVGLAHGTVAALFGDYYGETVNLAARLVGTAEPSTIVVSESVRDAVTEPGALRFDALEPQPLKGFPEPVPVFRLGRAR